MNIIKNASRIVVSSDSADKQLLREAALSAGFEISGKQIDRWRHERLLPRASVRGRGRGKGVERQSTEATIAQLTALCGQLKMSRSLDNAAFRLWIGGFDIPLERVRKALNELVIKPISALQANPRSLLTQIPRLEEKIASRKSARERVRTLAMDGELGPMLNVMAAFSFGVGDRVTPDERVEFIRTFEQAAALDRARGDKIEDTKPWLSGDITNEILAPLKRFSHLIEIYERANDEALLRNRATFIGFETIIAFAKVLQDRYDPEVLGLAVLTDSIIGLDTEKMGALVFVGLLLLHEIRPDIDEQISMVGATAKTSLELLSKQATNNN